MRAGIVCLLIVLAGCSNADDDSATDFTPARPISEVASDTVSDTFYGAWDLVQMPFEDIGLKQQPIPDRLQKIVANPYALPRNLNCESLSREIAELDTLLGPDVCTPQNPTGVRDSNNPSYTEQGAKLAREQAVGIVGSKTNIIPFRGVVRRISGAEKHAKTVERAYNAGRLRRAFLKGLVAALGPQCRNSPIENPSSTQTGH